ncbi:MAG TPA: hypothetical protein VEU07_16715 [Candidatus Acidoferrum sp.]|nr:hypothetical protein [Candidatus Acidoferrum sp.]
MTPETESVRIDGERVRLVRAGGDGREVVRREVLLSELAEALAAHLRADRTPILPAGTRLYVRWRHTAVLVIEEPPRVRRLRWSAKTLKSEGEYSEHNLAFPFVVYLVGFHQDQFEEMRVYFRPAPLLQEADLLYFPSLWNVQAAESPLARCRACLRGRPEILERPMADQAATLIEFFWTAGFNRDIEDNCFDRARGRDPRIGSLEAWEAATTADPLFPLSLSWEPVGLSLGEALDHWRRHGDQARRVENAADVADVMYRLHEAPGSESGAGPGSRSGAGR